MEQKGEKEQREHGNLYKPYSYYRSEIPQIFPNVVLHWHSEIELNYMISGKGEFICGDEHITASEGDMIIILPNMLHSIEAAEKSGCRYDTVVFNASMLGAEDTDRETVELMEPLLKGSFAMSCHITGEQRFYRKFRECAEAIFSCIKKDSAVSDICLKSELIKFFWLLFESGKVSAEKNTVQNGMEQFRPAVEYINEHYSEHITIDMLADKVHLSKSYFMASFRKYTGISAMEYVNRVRIRAAERKLWEVDESVVNIAYECGFRNLSNFNRQFKGKTGITPSAYRKNRLP